MEWGGGTCFDEVLNWLSRWQLPLHSCVNRVLWAPNGRYRVVLSIKLSTDNEQQLAVLMVKSEITVSQPTYWSAGYHRSVLETVAPGKHNLNGCALNSCYTT